MRVAMLSLRVIPFAALFVLQEVLADASDAVWTASNQECTPKALIPPGGRCVADDQCEFGECDQIYNFCREKCCTASGGNTCTGMACWPSVATRRTTHCGAAGSSWSLFPCRLGQPDVGGFKCEGNLKTANPRPPPGLCSSFKNTILTNPSNSAYELESAVPMDLTDPRCGCTTAVKELWAAGAFVGHWSSSYSFVSACGGGTINVTSNTVVLTMVVDNVDYTNLTGSGTRLSAFKTPIKVFVAEEAGHNITQHDVVVGIADVAGRVTARNAGDITFANVAATITVPSGVKATTVQTQLSTSHSLAQGLAILLRGVDGMSSALTVSNVQVVLGTAVSAVYSQLADPTEVSGSGQLEDAVTTSPPQLRGVAATSSLAAGKGPCGSYVLACVIIAAASLGHVCGL